MMSIWGAFSVPYIASAATFYQQLDDSSGAIELTGSRQLVGSFMTTENHDITNGLAHGLVVYNPDNNVAVAAVRIEISTTTPNGGAVVATYDTENVGSTDSDLFLDLLANGSGTLIAGQMYYIFASLISNSQPGNSLRLNLSEDFFYGYLTDTTGESIPIAPGIPGFTSAGISTTSQQVYCNQNFSTTTGLLDSVGQSIALGVCNVGVFLFVPSATVLQNFADTASSTKSKIPFSYYYDFAAQLDGASASTTGNFTVLSADLRGTGVGSTSAWASVLPASFAYLSSTTISTYVSPALYDLFFLLMRSAIWIAVLFHVYHRLVPKHAHKV